MHFDCFEWIYSSMLKKAEESSVFAQGWHGCLCVCASDVRACASDVRVCASDVRACASDVCAENFLQQRLLLQQSRAFYMLTLCLRAVLISSPDTRVWTRMHGLAVMHRRTLCENVDSAKLKVPFYTTDIDILRVASMHHIPIHCIDISDPYRWIVTPLILVLSINKKKKCITHFSNTKFEIKNRWTP